MLQPILPSQAHKPVGARQQGGTIRANNLDGSLSSLVGNFNFGENPVNKSDTKWHQPSGMEITGGLNWQLNTCTCTSTIWNPISVPPVPHMVPTPMEAPSLMAPQPMIYTQLGLRTNNPSTPATKIKTFRGEKHDDLSTA
nr:PREDICTED: phosphatidylinositol-binding clathrin assembly protein-like isoform X2 [Equus przewalskii]